MKVVFNIAISFCILLFPLFMNATSISDSISANAFVEKDSLEVVPVKDTLQNYNKAWPDCPEIKKTDLIELDSETFLLKWETAQSDRVEYSVEILQDGEIISKERSNSGVYIFQVDKGWSLDDLNIDIVTLCYFDNNEAPLKSLAFTSKWNKLVHQSSKFCDAYEDLIFQDHLKSFVAINTKFPTDVNFTFDICNSDECKSYDHSVTPSTVIEKNHQIYTFESPKLFTKFGNFDCSPEKSLLSTSCEDIVVEEIENCLYTITYPDDSEPACDLALSSHKITNSLCGHPTGRIVVTPYNGNKPYHYSWSNGEEGYENEINNLLPGSYIVTVTDVAGCQVKATIEIFDSNSVNFFANGGDGGLQDELILPPGMSLAWSFNPYVVSDQCIISGASIMNTGPITGQTKNYCQSNSSCICSDVFMGDYANGETLPIIEGTATKSGSRAVGNMIVPESGVLDINVIGANCASGTGWSLILNCNFQKSSKYLISAIDPSYVQFPEEVKAFIRAGKITQKQFVKDSTEFFKPPSNVTKPQRLKTKSITETLDFRCSGHVASPYTIKMFDTVTGGYYYCNIIDQLSCPECDSETDGCDLISYTLESDEWDPVCYFEWEVDQGINSTLEILNSDGEVVLQSADAMGTWSFETGGFYEARFTLENESMSKLCVFDIECPEPDLPPIDEKICDFFSKFLVSLENESSLYFNSESSLTQGEIDYYNNWLSQISRVELNMNWDLGPELKDHVLYESDNPDAANLFQLDPENMTFILNDYDMQDVWNQILEGETFSEDKRRLNYQFVITDLDGNKVKCDFKSVVEFPEEDKDDDNNNPLCLTCGDGVYDSKEDMEGYTLEDGVIYTGDLTDEIIYMYGFPIHITRHTAGSNEAEGILSLPFDDCKVLAVDLYNLEVVELPLEEKRYWVRKGEVLPDGIYPSEVPGFETAPDFEFGAEICIPPRAPNDVDGNGIDDNTKLDKYGFDSNGKHMNGTNFDNNGFDSEGNYMGCPRTDDPTLDCSMYNQDGCNRDGLNEDGDPCPTIDDEEWDEFVDEFEETSDEFIADLICDFATESEFKLEDKISECDSLRVVLVDDIDFAEVTDDEELLIRGLEDKYIDEGMSDFFNSKPKILTPAVGGRNQGIINIEKSHVDLYYCDIKIDPLREKANDLGPICDEGYTSELQEVIDQALEDLSNLDKQRLMLDENAFKAWVQKVIKDHLSENHNIYIGEAMPNSIEVELFGKPTKAFYKGYYSDVAAVGDDFMLYDNTSLDAIDFEYGQGFDEINGVNRAFYVSQLGKYNLDNFSALGGQEPIAIQSIQQSSIFSIYLVKFRFFVDKPALIDAYIELDDPKSDRKIYFVAKDVEYNPNGIETARMELATNISKFKISNAARGTIEKGEGTYLDFDCGGVKEIGIKGEVEFCDNIIVPMQQIANKDDYERHDDEYFTMGFEAKFQEWLEFETKITAKSPFAMAEKEDLIWKVEDFVFDFSSITSGFASGFNVPSGFNSEFAEGTTLGAGWKGFYCESLEAVLPALTKNENGDRYTAASVSNLLIDKYGVTCSAEVSAQILGLGKPNMKTETESSGWSMSIDYFRLDAVQNFIVGGGIRGKILTSLFKDDDNSALDYSALILPGNKYKFSVSPKTDLEVPLLVATANIKRSAITVLYDADNEDFTAEAKFTGNLKIDNDLAGAALPSLDFTDLTVLNKSPYITSGKWKLKPPTGSGNNNNNSDEDEDSGSYKGFSFSLENLKFESCEGGPLLATTINVGFGLNGDNSEDDEGGVKNSNLNISGDFGLKGRFAPNANNIQGFTFEKAFLNGLSVSGNIGEAVKDIDVKLCWDDDNPDYGDTFYGSGMASILDFGTVGVAAQFGKKDGEKYFFVDAFAELPVAIPLGGPIGINQLGAGVSNNMSIQTTASGTGTPTPPGDTETCSPPGCASNFGQTYTGFTYTFDKSKALAMRASVGFKMMEPMPEDFVEGAAGIDIEFFDGGGISKFGFFGEATLLASFPGKLGKVVNFINEKSEKLLDAVDLDADVLNLDGAKPLISGESLPLMARVEGSLDFGNDEFDLKAGAYLDWGVLKGAGKDNALFVGKIHIGDEWNVSLGTPSSPSGVDLKLGIVDVGFKTYFMAGNPLAEPWVPYLPEKVDAFFGGVNDFKFLDDMPASGAGVAFGVHFKAGFEISVPVLGSAYADLMTGIDVAMINGIRCNGKRIGMGSGWYAMGQAYLYAGAGVRVLGVDLIKGEAGILMNAGLTNPSFFNGKLKVSGKFGVWPLKFNVSGSLDVELGSEPHCKWYVFDPGEVIEVLGEMVVVESTFPITESEDVSTNLSEYIVNYSVPVGEVIELVYPDTLSDGTIEDQTIEYRVRINKIKFDSEKTDWSKTVQPSGKGTSHKIEFYNTFASDDNISVKVIYSLDMKAPGASSFETAIVEEELDYYFKTGPLALRFEPANIVGTWPEDGMENFYLDHTLDWDNKRQGIVHFRNSFPWEIFDTPGIEVRTSLLQGDNVEPLIDVQLDPTRYFNVETEQLTNAGSLYFDLPEDMELGKRYKVNIYAILEDAPDVKIPLMDPINFRTSLYYNLEEKFAVADSMFYIEASPRWSSEILESVSYNYSCGFEFNLVSKDEAPESWDIYDSKHMNFGPLCGFDNNRTHPRVNSTDFVECEFNGLDSPPGWEFGPFYELATVGDALSVPNGGGTKQSQKVLRAETTGPGNATIQDIYFQYRLRESLYYRDGSFLLKSCQ